MNLTTQYLGLTLQHPIAVSACPLSDTLEGIKALEDNGAAAIVLYSLFEEQIRKENEAYEELMNSGSDSFAESLNYFPQVDSSDKGTEHYLKLIEQAVKATDIPIIGSLNGTTPESWIEYARLIEQAGAHALELNIYYLPTDLTHSGVEVEQRYLDIVKTVKNSVTIPVAIKLSPFFSSTGHFATQLDQAGADGLVLFNRFFQPDFNLQTLTVEPCAQLSGKEEIRLPLLWTAVLHGRIKASIAASRGVQSVTEIVKYILAGADVVMLASLLMKHGPQHLQVLTRDLSEWLEARGYSSIDEIRGKMSRINAANPEAFERVNYIKTLESASSLSWDKMIT
jgi:dihydroorotate dehydrogenase (fumarate)